MDDLWATKSEDVGLIDRAISFQYFQPMWSWSTNVTDGQTDGQTDRRHAIARPRFAAVVHRAVKTSNVLDHVLCISRSLLFTTVFVSECTGPSGRTNPQQNDEQGSPCKSHQSSVSNERMLSSVFYKSVLGFVNFVSSLGQRQPPVLAWLVSLPENPSRP